MRKWHGRTASAGSNLPDAAIAAPATPPTMRKGRQVRLADKVCIITGAGGGMGRVASKRFAEEGAKVVVAEFSEPAGQETVRQVTEAGGTATYVQADVSAEKSAKAMV